MTPENLILVFIIAAFVIYLLESYLINEKKKHMINMTESQFLLGAINFEQYKHQMLQVMELVYQKAGESDPQFVKDFDKIKESIIKKCDELGNLYITNLKNSLGRETKYNNWREAIKYTEELLKKLKNDDSRKGN